MQQQLIHIVHLYANQYGWTRAYILDNVYVDEHILHEKIIKQEQKQKIMLDAQIALLPHVEEKSRKEFFEMLEDEKEPTEVKENVSLKDTKRQIEEAKRKLQNIN
jgi:KaiC/GvpD/RAD55 family RecA-like ATPase